MLQENITKTVNWFRESMLIKLCFIGVLTLVLLIPSVLLQDLIRERQQRQDEVTTEISDKWSGEQLLEGPILVLPYLKTVAEKNEKGIITYKEELQNIYLLPEELHINSKVNPETLHRGIFETVVYNSNINVNGKFSQLELKKSGIDSKQVLWSKSKVVIGLSDLKGLKNNPNIILNGKSYEIEPEFTQAKLFQNNLIALIDLSTDQNTALPFSFNMDLRGSSELNFFHLGKTTTLKMEGNWADPSFTGRYLPEKRNITKDGFKATWKIPHFNRSFPQQWIEKEALATPENNKPYITANNDNTFGVRFILAVDQYQKNMRSAKYAILIILLTFLSLFFTELLSKKKIHLLHYALIGAAMIIYYTLLLSFSEQFGFNAAYLIASAATIILVIFFLLGLLKSKKPALVFGVILSVFYAFIFVIIQLQDFSLLFGSVGLFIIIATMMYLSTKLNWERRTAPEIQAPQE